MFSEQSESKNWLQKNPIVVQPQKGEGQSPRAIRKNPEEGKGHESYCLGYWVKLVIDVWCFNSGSKLQGRLKPKMEAGF